MRIDAARHQVDGKPSGGRARERGQVITRPRPDAVRLGPAIAGVIAPAVFCVAVTIAGLIRPGYNPFAQFVSELGVGPHAWIYNSAVIALGLLELPFVLRLTGTLAPTRASRIARGLLVAFCGTTCLLAIIPTRHRIVLQDASFLHVLAFVAGVACLIVAFWLLASRFAEETPWRRLARPSQVIAIIACVFLVVPIALGPNHWYEWAGLLQRVFLSVLLVWLEVLAIALLKFELAA